MPRAVFRVLAKLSLCIAASAAASLPAAAQPASDPDAQHKADLIVAYRILVNEGILDSFGHISVRSAKDPNVFFMPRAMPPALVSLDDLMELRVADSQPVDPKGRRVNGERYIHGEIYKARPDANCVMHTHTTAGVSVASLEGGLSQSNFYSAQLHDMVAYHEFEGITETADESERIARELADKAVLILRNHGLLAWGGSLPEAFGVMYSLQRACDTQIAASAAGSINRISAAAMELSRQEFIANEPRACQLLFDAMVRQLDLPAIDYRS